MFESFKAAKRLTEAEEAIQRIERRLTALEIQWTDTLDRLKSMMGRILKERSRTQQAAERMEEMQPQLSDEDIAAGHNQMSQRQHEINARILARRNRSPQ